MRVGQMFDGREVRTMSFYPGAVEGANVGLVNYYTDGSSGAYLVTMSYQFDVPALNLSTRFRIGSNPDEVGILGIINLEKPPPPRRRWEGAWSRRARKRSSCARLARR